MRFENGNTFGKGRPLGVPNKSTRELRAMLSKFVSENWQQVMDGFDTFEPNEQANFLLKILPFVIPKMESVPAETEEGLTPSREEMIKEMLSRIPSDELMKMIDELRNSD